MKGLKCNDFKCIYLKEKECTATDVYIINHNCVTTCCEDDVKDLMTHFKGGRKDQRVSGVLK